MALPLALLAIGCAPTPEAATPDPPSGPCDASRLGALVGRAYTEALAADAQRRSGARAVRRIRPGDMVTMDFRGDRLNVHLDDADRVVRFDCG
jgi:hypothetical protein